MKPKFAVLPIIFALMLSACAKKEENKAAAISPPATLISVAKAENRKLEVVEQAVGEMEGLVDPTVGAEVAARVVQVLAHAGQAVKKGQLLAVLDAVDLSLQRREAQAEIGRIEALLANQGKTVDRNQRLVEKNFISRSALDDAASQQDVIRQQLEGARAQLATIEHNTTKTRILAPVDGRVEKQIVSPGDFVKIGDPLFQVIGMQRLRAHLPFPEGVAAKLHAGQTVRLSTPTSPDKVFTTTIREIKPLIGTSNRAADVIADVVDQAGWQAGASVTAVVVLGEHTEAIVVPETSVVLRPAGEVVYVIKDNVAYQRIIQRGLRQDGMVEIASGLSAGETVAVDGSGFLTDKAPVKILQANDK